MPYQWIDRINESNSRLHKEKTIGEAYTACKLGDKTACDFLECAKRAYDPFVNYYTKNTCETENITGAKNNMEYFWYHLDDLSNRRITGHNAICQTNATSDEYDSELWNKLLRPTLMKDLRIGATAKTFNKILKGTDYEIPTFECMLASDSKKHEKKLVGEKFVQKKLDGVRCIAIMDHTEVNLYSRNGKPLENFKEVERSLRMVRDVFYKALPYQYEPIVLDGEIMSEDFQSLMRQAQRKQNVQTDDCVYHIFDYLMFDDFKKGVSNQVLDNRYEFLMAIKEKLKNVNNIDVVEAPLIVDLNTDEGHQQMHDYARQCVKDGYEGVMIKDRYGSYECKRSTQWLKWKPVITVDLKVVDLEEGTGRNVGKLGALVCEGVDQGKRIKVNVGSGLTDENREEFWTHKDKLINELVEIQADAITQNQDTSDEYSLRFPRFVRFRSFEGGEKV